MSRAGGQIGRAGLALSPARPRLGSGAKALTRVERILSYARGGISVTLRAWNYGTAFPNWKAYVRIMPEEPAGAVVAVRNVRAVTDGLRLICQCEGRNFGVPHRLIGIHSQVRFVGDVGMLIVPAWFAREQWLPIDSSR